MYNKYLENALAKVTKNSDKIGARFPHVVREGKEFNEEPDWFWTAGFWGGVLWLTYLETGNEKLFELAYEIEEKLDKPLYDFVNLHHDVGFMWIATALAHYNKTGYEKSKVRCIKAANILAARFNIKGNYIKAWNDPNKPNINGMVIIDSMMNLPILYWASKELNDPRFKHIAMAHADTVIAKMLRDDDTLPHIGIFDEFTGEKLWNLGGQGKAPDSVWARGQSWAIYGFAISYRETKKEEYLDVAKRVAKKYMSLLPEDGIPYWDFSCAEDERYAKDTSSAACAASGMLEIAKFCTDKDEAEYFTNQAKTLLTTLGEKCACFDDTNQGIIQMGTVHFPMNRDINVPIIYADYYFIEALRKLKGADGLF